MGRKGPLLRRKPSFTTDFFGDSVELDQALGPILDTKPQDVGPVAIWKRSHLAQDKFEACPQSGLVQLSRKDLHPDLVDRAEESDREVPVVRWDHLAGKGPSRQVLSQHGFDL
jgi:hypothetical protein